MYVRTTWTPSVFYRPSSYTVFVSLTPFLITFPFNLSLPPGCQIPWPPNVIPETKNEVHSLLLEPSYNSSSHYTRLKESYFSETDETTFI